MKINQKLTLFTFIPLLAGGFNACSVDESTAKQKLPNILMIPVDDLRPDLGCYGNEFIQTPNIDRLASRGVVFSRTYCQQAVCNPSRASLLTGLRPDSIQVWDLQTKFRDILPNIVTLPQYFKEKGYISIGLGKTFQNNIPDTLSWTEKPHIDGYPFDPDAVYFNEENLQIQEQKKQALIAKGDTRRIDQLGHWYLKANSIENADVEDDAYFDGAQTTLAIEKLQGFANQDKPFFLSVGYYRPHLPFNAPKKYWDLYDRETLPLAKNQFPPEGSPEYAVHGDAELRGYSDRHDLPWPHESSWDEDKQREMIHGYYASVSYVDAQIGRLLDELDRLGLAENTIILLWGDHGWKLGEHNGWGKMTNYEIDTRVPMIFSGAGVKAKGSQSDALTEFIDIYPTLVDMAGFKVPKYLQGVSVVPLLYNPERNWKTATFSQYLLGRFGPPKKREFERMGYTIRTDQFRYVEWYNWDKETNQKTDFLSRELFDHNSDSQENTNIANQVEFAKTVKQLSRQLKAGWRSAKPVLE